MSLPLRILWLKSGPLHPLDTGGKLRTYHMMRELSREHRVTYLSLLPPETAPEIKALAREYSQNQIWIPWQETSKRSPRFALELAANFFASNEPYVISKYRSSGMFAAIQKADEAGDFDLIVCDFLTPSINLPKRLRTPVLLFQHNVESLIWKRLADTATGLKKLYFRNQWQRMEAYEKAACSKCAGVVAVSDADAAILRDQFGLPNVYGSVPTGVDVEHFANTTSERKSGSIVFLGSMDWMPNIDGALWFCEEVWPAIKARIPHATLSIVGRKPPGNILSLAASDPAIRVTGTVDDVRPYLAEAAVMVVPLRVGGGTRIKIFEGMAAGLPVVSTSIGAEGLDVTHGKDIILADEPEVFAEQTVKLLLQDLERNFIAENGQSLVRDFFSWQTVTKVFIGYCRRAAPSLATSPK